MRPRGLQDELNREKPFDLPEEEAFQNVVRTASMLSTEFTKLFRREGLTDSSYNVLRILRGAGPGGKRSQQIAGDMVVQLPDITRLVDRLEARGFCTRGRSDDDRRVVIVRITPEGTAALDRLDAPVAALHRKQLGHMSQDRLAALSDLLSEARETAEDLLEK